jgi:hypothetical protein
MKVSTLITIDPELMKMAKEKGINMSGTLNQLLREHFRMDKILEAKRIEEEIIRLQAQQKKDIEEREAYEKAKKQRDAELLDRLKENPKFIEFMKTFSDETSPDEIMAFVRVLINEGFKIGFIELERILKNG